MRVLFAGSPELAVPSLERLARNSSSEPDSPIELIGVLSNPDTPKGRSGKLEPTPVARAAYALSSELIAAGKTEISVLKPIKLDSAAREAVAALRPDLLVSVAYGKIFGPRFLALFPKGGINLHPSLLPRYRGATPIPAAILAGERETGISVQRLAAAMDSGDILLREKLRLSGRETTASLSAIAAQRGAELLVSVITMIAAGKEQAYPQDEAAATYCGRIAKDDGLIDWNLSAKRIDAQVRAYTPWPLAFSYHNDRILFVLESAPYPESSSGATPPPGTIAGIDKTEGILVQTGNALLAIKRLQYGGKKALDWRVFLNGAPGFMATRLGASADIRRNEVNHV